MKHYYLTGRLLLISLVLLGVLSGCAPGGSGDDWYGGAVPGDNASCTYYRNGISTVWVCEYPTEGIVCAVTINGISCLPIEDTNLGNGE